MGYKQDTQRNFLREAQDVHKAPVVLAQKA
jgi:hypothetical protein